MLEALLAVAVSGPARGLLDRADFLLAAPPGLITGALSRLDDGSDRYRRIRVWRSVPPTAPPTDRAFLLDLAAGRFALDPFVRVSPRTRPPRAWPPSSTTAGICPCSPAPP